VVCKNNNKYNPGIPILSFYDIYSENRQTRSFIPQLNQIYLYSKTRKVFPHHECQSSTRLIFTVSSLYSVQVKTQEFHDAKEKTRMTPTGKKTFLSELMKKLDFFTFLKFLLMFFLWAVTLWKSRPFGQWI